MMKNLRWIALICILLGLVVSQVLIGGARMVFALPGYGLIALGGALLLFAPTPRPVSMRACWCLLSGLVFALYIVGRAWDSPVVAVARPDLLLALAALVVYWAVARYVRSPEERIILLWVLIGVAVVHAVVGFMQFKVARDFMIVPGIKRPTFMSYGWRASGMYIYPSHLAGLLEMVGFSTLALCCWARWKTGARLVAGHAAAICFGGLAITGSRGGYVSALAGLVIFVLLSLVIVRRVHPRRSRLMIGIILASACGLLGAFYFFMADSTILTDRMESIYEPENGRIFLWHAALEQFRLAPIWGTGAGTYLFFGRLLRSPSIQGDPVHVHCDYLELLGEYGLIGLGATLFFLVLHLRSGFRALRQILATRLRPGVPPASKEMALVVGALTSLGAVLVHSMIDFNFHLPANTLVAAAFLGMLATPQLTESLDVGSRWQWLTAALPVALPAALLLWLAIPLWPAESLGEKARVALRERQYLDAWGLAEQAAARDPRNPVLHFYAAEAQHFLTEAAEPADRTALHEGALNALDKALALSPSDTFLLLRRAQLLDLLGRDSEAEAAYRQTIASDPNFATPHAYFGLHWKRRQQFWLAQCSWLKANALGENAISGRGLAELAKLKKDPLVQALSPNPFRPIDRLDLPAPSER